MIGDKIVKCVCFVGRYVLTCTGWAKSLNYPWFSLQLLEQKNDKTVGLQRVNFCKTNFWGKTEKNANIYVYIHGYRLQHYKIEKTLAGFLTR